MMMMISSSSSTAITTPHRRGRSFSTNPDSSPQSSTQNPERPSFSISIPIPIPAQHHSRLGHSGHQSLRTNYQNHLSVAAAHSSIKGEPVHHIHPAPRPPYVDDVDVDVFWKACQTRSQTPPPTVSAIPRFSDRCGSFALYQSPWMGDVDLRDKQMVSGLCTFSSARAQDHAQH